MDVPPLLDLLQQWLREAAIKRYWNLQLLSLSFLVLAISVLLHRVWSLSKRSKTYKLPPSPPRIPILGNLHQLDALAHRSFRDLSQKYGPLMLLHLGQSPNLVVSSVEMATEIMKNQDLVFANRPSTTAAIALLYGCTDISFAPYGEYWRQVRKICVLELLSAKRVQSFKNLREEEVKSVIQIISSSCLTRDGVVINLSKLLLTLANNIISRCTLGAKYESAHENKFGQLSREVFRLLGAFSFHDYFPSVGWMDVVTGLSSRLKKVSQELDAFFDRVIEEHLVRHSKAQDGHGQVEDTSKLDLMDILLLSQKDNTNVSRNNIKAIILNMFLGGTDTTTTIMEWTMAELIKNPKVMKIAQDEVRRVVGNKCKIEEEDINQMDYLKCIVKEILRLHTPIPLLLRESSKSTQITGYDIPPNTKVFINVWAIQRDAKFWGNPEEFRPERFINNHIDFKGQEFEFIPFGSGRRGCPGITFGITVVEYTLANLLYHFNWELPAGDKREDLDMTEVLGITLNKKIPLNVVPTIYASPQLENGAN
ncbi:cytochrome P450 71A1-like isoform X1 [Papaver somniferum]|uniref:cytochrome P450 71A1-like isoform X1 n=1 Tax=Papaver somniferum TaxID=3469 RepID=UPI000E6FC8A9|nr:cytochrome P450 71A1-like isoform X1 [Papaver somniferum]